jgi:IS30 family transposase
MATHLTEEEYAEIKKMKAAGFSLSVIGRKFGRRYSTISNICNGKTYPKEAKTDRLNRRLTDDEYENIRRLHAKGLQQKVIAERIDRSCSVVCMALKHLAEMDGTPVEKRTYKDIPPIVDVDLSKLPDTVLFKHSREFCF